MKNNNKGFTMVEILAAIVIMGLLTTIAIVSVSKIIDKATKNHYDTQEKNMIMATQSYVNDNRNILPKEIGGSKIVTLKELQNRKYIGDVLDRSKINCSNDTLDAGGSYVEIFRYSKDGYSYKAYLKCNKYETSKEEYGGAGPEINLTINTNYDNPSFSYEINGTTDAKIISYSYVIYKHGVLVRDSGSVPVSKVSKVENKVVSLKDLVPGEFKIVFTATNMYGKTNTVTKEAAILDGDGPTCGTVEPEINEWSNAESVTISIGCIDEAGSGCAREIFSQKFTEQAKTNFIEISDNLGNVTPCTVNTYIDRDAPSKPTINNPYENTWINKSYSINVTSTDAVSGIKHFQYRYPESAIPEEREWHTYADSSKNPGDSTPFTTTEFSQERGEYVEIRACDYAGNCSETTKSMIKIDKTPASCTIVRNINTPNGENNWYVTEVNMSMRIVDIGGGATTAIPSPISYELTTSSTASYTGMNLTATQTDTTSSGVTYRGYIQDEAGNKSSCTEPTGILKVDLTTPDAPVITNPNANTDGTIKWINADYAVTAKAKDIHSGIKNFQYSRDNSNWTDIANSSANPNTYKTVTSETFTAEGNYGYYVRVCDKAGRCSASSQTTIKLDKTPPICVSSGGSDSWKKTAVTLTGTCSENTLSGCVGNVTKDYKTDTNATNQSPGSVKDVAGNVTNCPANQTVKVDVTKPKISFAVAPGVYDENDGISVTSTCSDPNEGTTGSGVASKSGATAISSPTKDKTVKHTCTDVAGNTAEVSGTYSVRHYSSSYLCGAVYNSCETEECGVKSYKTCAHEECGAATYKTCEAEICGFKTCAHKDCGTYCSTSKTGNSYANCGGWSGSWSFQGKYPGLVSSAVTDSYQTSCTYVADDFMYGSASNCLIMYAKSCTWCTQTSNNTCATASCGLNSCSIPACGVEEYKTCTTEGCGVASYNTCANSACGVYYYKTCWHY